MPSPKPPNASPPDNASMPPRGNFATLSDERLKAAISAGIQDALDGMQMGLNRRAAAYARGQAKTLGRALEAPETDQPEPETPKA